MRPSKRTAGSCARERRLTALVIGNADYADACVFKNPRNDAEDISAKLEDCGFTITTGEDEIQLSGPHFSRSRNSQLGCYLFYIVMACRWHLYISS